MNSELIRKPFPFGKYKGKPLSALLGDPSYCRWLLGCEGFQDDPRNREWLPHIRSAATGDTTADRPQPHGSLAVFDRMIGSLEAVIRDTAALGLGGTSKRLSNLRIALVGRRVQYQAPPEGGTRELSE